jgi:hypothetical protein
MLGNSTDANGPGERLSILENSTGVLEETLPESSFPGRRPESNFPGRRLTLGAVDIQVDDLRIQCYCEETGEYLNWNSSVDTISLTVNTDYRENCLECSSCGDCFHKECVTIKDSVDFEFHCHECIEQEDLDIDWDAYMTERYGDAFMCQELAATKTDIKLMSDAVSKGNLDSSILEDWKKKLQRFVKHKRLSAEMKRRNAQTKRRKKATSAAPRPMTRQALKELNSI